MRVLFLMFAFPDMNDSFNMYTAMVDMFHKNNHSVTVVAPASNIKESAIITENGIEILRVKTLPFKNVSNIRKGIANLLLPYQYQKEINKFYKNRKFDVIILPTPPITLGSLAANLKKKHKAQVYLILRDIFPQNAVDLGFMKKDSFIHKLFKAKETKLYKTADYIGCMSQANIDFIKNNHKVSNHKLHVLRNWQFDNTNADIKTSIIRQKYNLINKFVVVFGGNMGKPQQLENVLELAHRCKENTEIVFILLGEGVMIEKIKIEVKVKGLDNIYIHRSIPKLEYQSLIKDSDVGLISLHKDFTIPNIPSKAVDYWNIGIPILGSLDKATDFGKVLDETQTGLWAYSGEHKKLYEKLIELHKSSKLRNEMSENGRLYFKKYLTAEIAYETIIEKL
jgi:glycosyltransferase involved in cell wall biosynthesis